MSSKPWHINARIIIIKKCQKSSITRRAQWEEKGFYDGNDKHIHWYLDTGSFFPLLLTSLMTVKAEEYVSMIILQFWPSLIKFEIRLGVLLLKIWHQCTPLANHLQCAIGNENWLEYNLTFEHDSILMKIKKWACVCCCFHIRQSLQGICREIKFLHPSFHFNSKKKREFQLQ